MKGRTVAVKIRHPKIIQRLETDINILYSWMNFFSKVLRVSISMPVTIEEFKRTLVS